MTYFLTRGSLTIAYILCLSAGQTFDARFAYVVQGNARFAHVVMETDGGHFQLECWLPYWSAVCQCQILCSV